VNVQENDGQEEGLHLPAFATDVEHLNTLITHPVPFPIRSAKRAPKTSHGPVARAKKGFETAPSP